MDCLRDKWGSTNDNFALAIELLDDHLAETNYVCRFIYVFVGFFFVIHVYFAVHVCSFCFYLYLYFFSTVWISTRRNTLIASVLVTGKLFFVKSLFNVFKTNASDMHKKNDIQ